MSDEYAVHFAVDGTLSVLAESPEAAAREAVEILQCLGSMDAERFDVDGCTIRVTARITDDAYESLDERSQCVEFAS